MTHSVMVAGMAAVVIAPGTMLLVAIGLLVAAIALARSARAQVWAREAIVDLWTMTLLIVSAVATAGHPAAASNASTPAGPAPAQPAAGATGLADTALAHPGGWDSAVFLGSHHGGAPTGVFEIMLTPVVVLLAWGLARVALGMAARRTGSIQHSVLTAAASGAQLLLMLAVH